MKKIYKIDSGFGISLTLEVDLEKMTPEIATEINNFWVGSDDVLAASNGDVIEAAIRRAAPILIFAAIDGFNSIGMIDQLNDVEGWPTVDQLGIRVLLVQIPDIDAVSLNISVVDGGKT